MASSYLDQLNDYRWKSLASHVRRIANYTCEECGDRNTELHVHHTFYMHDMAPWEYPEWSLQCLCWRCHEKAHGIYDAANDPEYDLFAEG